jgi:hypothetical protein
MEAFTTFLNSNFLQTVVTLVAGLFALYIYTRQKRDHKKAAANSIYLEIQHVERCIPKIKDAVRRGGLNNLDINVLREDAWSKYSHMFSSDFDKDEWETITDFYQTAHLLDEAITESNKAFSEDVAQIRVNKQRIIADITKELLLSNPDQNPEAAIQTYNQKLDVFDKLYMSRQEEFAYTPVKHKNDAEKCLEDIQKISITTIGEKFKNIIGIT